MKNFLTSQQFKKMAEEISALSGIKESSIMIVWEYTLFKWLLEFCKDGSNEKDILVPYLGTIHFSLGDEYLQNDKVLIELNPTIDISQTFQKIVGDIHDGDVSQLKEFFESQIEDIIGKI